jgi:outer membrane protein
MMKALVYPLLAAALFVGGASSAFGQALHVGTVDMKKVFENYKKTKDAESRINEARNQAKKELEDQMEAYKKATEDVAKINEEISRPELSPSAKEAKTKIRDEKIGEIKNMERDIRDFQTTREKQLTDQTMRMRSGIVDEINRVVADKVKSDQYDIVFDRSGQSLNGVPLILYAKDSYDFTNDVITALNKNAAAEPAAPAAPAVPATPAKTSGKKSK